jgi:hypothetical protein
MKDITETRRAHSIIFLQVGLIIYQLISRVGKADVYLVNRNLVISDMTSYLCVRSWLYFNISQIYIVSGDVLKCSPCMYHLHSYYGGKTLEQEVELLIKT